MDDSLDHFLEELTRRGSWIGGGSVAAVSAALAAALLEKLIATPARAQPLRQRRLACLRLAQRDAEAFARVIQATRKGDPHEVQRALKTATGIPWQVFQHAQAIQRVGRRTQRSLKPRFRSDLACAMVLARASGDSARILIRTNLAWLNDAKHTRMMRRRLKAAVRPRVRS